MCVRSQLTALNADQLYELSLKIEPLAESASGSTPLSPRFRTGNTSTDTSNLGMLLKMERRLTEVEQQNLELRMRIERLEAAILNIVTTPTTPTTSTSPSDPSCSPQQLRINLPTTPLSSSEGSPFVPRSSAATCCTTTTTTTTTTDTAV
jgi:hypothetical protein